MKQYGKWKEIKTEFWGNKIIGIRWAGESNLKLIQDIPIKFNKIQ